MGSVCWDFPLLGTGNESGSNIAAITMFKGAGVMDGLAREGAQNSLDAKNKELGKEIPVRMKFELYKVKKTAYSIFAGFENAIKNSRDYWNNSPLKTEEMITFLDSIEAALALEEIPILVMSDYNTTGLKGVNAGPDEKSLWDLLVNTEGISIKDDKSSGGSYGIGKNAPFAYSALNLICYNTLATDGGRAFEGVARLATSTREYKGQMRKTQPIGKYLYLEDMFTGRPILPSDKCDFAEFDAFKRSEYGTDVAIIGFKEEEYPEWEKLLVTAILKNFVMAILEGKFEAEVASKNVRYIISKSNMKDMLFDEFRDVPELKYTRQIYSTFVEPDKKVDVKIAEENDLTVYVKYNESYSQSLSRFRSTGMLINTTTGDVLPHYSVIVVANDVGEEKLSTTLRKAEPPQHTEWKAKYITDNKTLHNRAARYIRSIGKAVQEVLDDFDHQELEPKLDGGVGAYLPDVDNGLATGENTDGLLSTVKVDTIQRYDGRVIYNSSYKSATGATGKKQPGSAVKTGENHRRHKRKKKIKVVTPGGGNTKGVTPGTGKVRIISPDITDHRTFYMRGNKYRLFADCPTEYKNVYIQYFAARDDHSTDSDALVIKNIKIDGVPVKTVGKDKVGPLEFKAGSNVMYVEFENKEIMAVVPVFTMEVQNEE